MMSPMTRISSTLDNLLPGLGQADPEITKIIHSLANRHYVSDIFKMYAAYGGKQYPGGMVINKIFEDMHDLKTTTGIDPFSEESMAIFEICMAKWFRDLRECLYDLVRNKDYWVGIHRLEDIMGELYASHGEHEDLLDVYKLTPESRFDLVRLSIGELNKMSLSEQATYWTYYTDVIFYDFNFSDEITSRYPLGNAPILATESIFQDMMTKYGNWIKERFQRIPCTRSDRCMAKATLTADYRYHLMMSDAVYHYNPLFQNQGFQEGCSRMAHLISMEAEKIDTR